MALKKLTLKTSAAHQNQRLDAVLAAWLPDALGEPVSKAKVRKLIVAGAVYLNGRRVRIASKLIMAGAQIEAMIDRQKLQANEASRDRVFTLGKEHVLFEDDWLIAINKPAGLPTQPTLDEARDNLFAAVKAFAKTRAPGPGLSNDPYIGLHHRLDRDTSGVVLFTRRTDANAGTADLFSKHLAQKTYQAISRGNAPGPEWTVKNYLGKLDASGKRARFGAVRSGGDFAHTEFKLLQKLARANLIEAMPRTGRTHQIRVHLAEAGMPILGDRFYGDDPPGAERVMLHALRLEFPHPMTGQKIVIECPLPEDFRAVLAREGGRPS